MRRPGPIAWSLCLLTAPACATSAMIRTPNDLPIEARIVSSDANAIEVETEAGGAARIPRTRIVDIDHPGKALALAGLCIVALVSISTASEATSIGDALLTNAILGAPGLTMIAWGGTAYVRSRRASAAFDSESTSLCTLPPNRADRPYLPPPMWSSPPGSGSGVPPEATP